MTVSKAFGYRSGPTPRPALPTDQDPHSVLGAVLDDVRQTLRCAWIDPAIETGARFPAFFTAAWSAIRPNVGKSFLSLTRSLRNEAVESLRAAVEVPSLRRQIGGELRDDDLVRMEEVARALHLVSAKVHIVVHALHRTARKERIVGTGGEEPPIRRGVPEWQRWIPSQPHTEAARRALDRAVAELGLPSTPVPLRFLAPWPAALSALWEQLRPVWGSEPWEHAATRLRRIVLAGLSTLPHPIELQWTALAMRGFTDEDLDRAEQALSSHEAAMPAQTLAAAFIWLSLGAPDIGSDG